VVQSTGVLILHKRCWGEHTVLQHLWQLQNASWGFKPAGCVMSCWFAWLLVSLVCWVSLVGYASFSWQVLLCCCRGKLLASRVCVCVCVCVYAGLLSPSQTKELLQSSAAHHRKLALSTVKWHACSGVCCASVAPTSTASTRHRTSAHNSIAT
jgi:hypothetical protein